MSTEKVLTQLENGALHSLVTLGMDHVLEQPVHALIEADWLAGQIVTALDAASNSEQTEDWIRDRIAQLRENPPNGNLRDQIPTEVLEPIRELVVRPFVPDRVIMGRMLGHKAVESLVRDLLVGALQSFAKRFKPNVPGAGRGLKSLKRVKEGVLGGIGQELERHAEGRVREFVDGILGQVLGQIADNICNPRDTESFGRFRGHLMDQMLDTSMRDLDRELGKLEPDALVETAAAIARSLAKREGLRDEVRGLLQQGLDEMGDRTIGAHLKEAGIDGDWRSEIEAKMVERSTEFIQTDGFKKWLEEVLN